jgi:hypothetical protein
MNEDKKVEEKPKFPEPTLIKEEYDEKNDTTIQYYSDGRITRIIGFKCPLNPNGF